MKTFRKRYEDIRDKATQLKQVLDAAPGKAAELRKVITQTVGEFQQLKDDFQIGTGAFPEVMDQITQAQDVFVEAGYRLEKVDMDVGLNPRLTLHLDREHEVRLIDLKALRQLHDSAIAVRSVLDALIKAEEVAAKVEIPGMTFRSLAVEIGMAPCVRLCWEADPEPAIIAPPPIPAPQPIAVAAAVVPLSKHPTPPPSQQPSAFGQGSFFERRSTPVQPQAPVEQKVEEAEVEQPKPAPIQPLVTASIAPTPKPAAAKSTSGGWKRDSLERFKKMPDLSR